MVSELIDVPTVKQRALSITVGQYHALGAQGLIAENTELLEGIIVEKVPKSPLHSALLARLLKRLQALMGDRFVVRPEQPITCRRSEPEPDLALVEVSPDDYATGHPRTAELIVEIAISSSEIDRRKAAIYAEAGVREYWIVLPETRQIEVHTQLVDSRFSAQHLYNEGETALSEVLPAFQVELATLFPR